MPTNKKSRKPYAPPVKKQVNPRMKHALIVFQPVIDLFAELKTGFLDTVNDKPIFDFHGEICEIAPALEGWSDCWQRISDAENLGIDSAPLKVMAERLNSGKELTENEVADGMKIVIEQFNAYLRIKPYIIRQYAICEEIYIHLEGLV
jgi:hypothetical protein